MSVLVRGIRWNVATLALSLLFVSQAGAVTTVFGFTSGDVRVTAFRADNPGLLLVDEIFPLTGSFVKFSDAPIGIIDFLLTIPQTSFVLSAPYGGYDNIVLESATLTPGAGYVTSGLVSGPFSYDVDGSPVAVDAIYSATDSSTINPALVNVPLPTFDGTFDGTVLTDLNQVLMNGITLGTVPGVWVGETYDLVVKGDITFFGVVPEPATGTILALGLVGLTLARRNDWI